MKRFITVFLTICTVSGMLIFQFRRLLMAFLLRLPAPQNLVVIERGLSILAEDGTILVANHYTPAKTPHAPTILIRSPYGRNTQQSGYGRILEFFANRFAERGYHVLVQ